MSNEIQLVVVHELAACQWFGPKKPGDVVWVNPDAARHLLEGGMCRYLSKPTGPTETPMGVGPSQTKKFPCRTPDGWPIDRFAVIERTWEGETVLCIGGGPSVTAAAVSWARGRCRTIAINNSYLLAPWADMLYFADFRWWEWHKDRTEFQQFAGQKVTIESTGRMVADPNIFMLHNYGHEMLSEKPNGVNTGSNSGFQVINIAVLAGAKRILLLGYDMRYPDGRSHWHDGHPIKIPEEHYTGTYAKKFRTMLSQLQRMKVEVVNCSMGSSIDAFPIVPLEEALK